MLTITSCLSVIANADFEARNGKYITPGLAHNLSYIDSEESSEYDALGVKSGNSVICFDYSNIKKYGYYPKS